MPSKMAEKVLTHYFNFQFFTILHKWGMVRFRASQGTHLQNLNNCHPPLLTSRDEVLPNQDQLLM